MKHDGASYLTEVGCRNQFSLSIQLVPECHFLIWNVPQSQFAIERTAQEITVVLNQNKWINQLNNEGIGSFNNYLSFGSIRILQRFLTELKMFKKKLSLIIPWDERRWLSRNQCAGSSRDIPCAKCATDEPSYPLMTIKWNSSMEEKRTIWKR